MPPPDERDSGDQRISPNASGRRTVEVQCWGEVLYERGATATKPNASYMVEVLAGVNLAGRGRDPRRAKRVASLKRAFPRRRHAIKAARSRRRCCSLSRWR